MVFEWSNKQKRAYHRVKSGVAIASLTNTPIQHIVLTTSEVAKNKNICNDFQILRKRIKRRWNNDLSYFCVRTNEGNGVLHVLNKDKGFIPQRWLSKQWNEIHKSPYVFIKRPPKHIANYVVTQYVSNQKSSFQRCSWSQTWVCERFVKIWRYCKDLSRLSSKWEFNKICQKWCRKINIAIALFLWEKFLKGLAYDFNYFRDNSEIFICGLYNELSNHNHFFDIKQKSLLEVF
jgi:hypothetical protein